MKFCSPESRFFPPAIVGSISDWDTWCAATEPGAEPECDIIELRLDALPDTVTAEHLTARNCPRPLLLTFRHESEGGCRKGWAESDRIARAIELLPAAQLLDWEIARAKDAAELLSEARKRGITTIASAHDFKATPAVSTMLALEDKALGYGMDVAKFAFRLNAAEDLTTGCELLEAARGPLAVMGMGELGPTSRLLFAQLGSCLVYGYLGSKPTAPGQWNAGEFKRAISMLVPSPA